jgi:hypothetical protein
MTENTMALTQSEITHYTNYWCKTKGISSKDLDQHPRADDLVLLISFRDAMWDKLNISERGCWAGYWSSIYIKKNKLKTKALNKLEQITITATDRHNQQQALLAIQRKQIKALKQNPYSKPVENIAAKDTGPTHSVPWE